MRQELLRKRAILRRDRLARHRCRAELGGEPLAPRRQQCRLGGEVEEERGSGDVGLVADLVDRYRLETPGGEQPKSRLEDGFPGARPLAAPTRLRNRLRSHGTRR